MADVGSDVLARTGRRVAPLSSAQHRLWFINVSEPASGAYNVPLLLRWRGTADQEALSVALAAVVDRHMILRTTYEMRDEQPVQVIAEDSAVSLHITDLAFDPDAATIADQQARQRARDPFDLAVDRPLRCHVWHGPIDGDLVLLCIHHIAIDGWSVGILLDDLAEAYAAAQSGRSLAWPDLGVQYADYAVWERARRESPATRQRLATRARELRKYPADIVLGARADALRAVDGATAPRVRLAPEPAEQQFVSISAPQWKAIQVVARRMQATPFVLLLAAFEVVVQRYSGKREFLLGTAMANRPRAELQDMVGFFVNTVPLRCEVAAAWSFRELCAQVRSETYLALGLQAIPYDRLVAALGGDRSAGDSPLVRIGFGLQNSPARCTADRVPWSTSAFLPTGAAKSDLTLSFDADEERLAGTLEYDATRYDGHLVRQIGDAFGAVLAAAVDDPDRPLQTLPLTQRAPGGLPPGVYLGERRNLASERLARLAASACPLDHHRAGHPATLDSVASLPTPHAAGPPTTVPTLVAASFSRLDSQACLVSCGTLASTTAELDSGAWAVAATLGSRGIGQGDFVPVIVRRGPALVAAWLGVLRTGAAYVPVDLDTPPARLEAIIRDVGARSVLVDDDGAKAARMAIVSVRTEQVMLPPGASGRQATSPRQSSASGGAPPVSGSEPATVIYTSGTSGQPKGVVYSHDNLMHSALAWAAALDLGPADRQLCTASTSFDPATVDVFSCLLSGARLVFADDDERRSPHALLALTRRPHGATVTGMTPSMLRALLDADDGSPTSLRAMSCGGEVLTRRLADECASRWGVTVRNIYGATECSGFTTVAVLRPGNERQPELGRPVPNTRLYLLSPDQEEVPEGVPGDVYLAGAGVTAGYLGRPELTAQRFLPDLYAPGLDARMYRTGDLAIRRPDGELEFVGRADQQFKVIGHRVELEEIEKLIGDLPGIRAAAALAEGDPPRVTAYVELSGPPPSYPTFVTPLLRWLPAAVLPAAVYVVDRLPLTRSGKVDRTSLRDTNAVALVADQQDAAELTAAERRAAGLFAEALAEQGLDIPASTSGTLARDSNFFLLGGHSLLAVRMVVRAAKRSGADVPLRDFLRDPTVAGLARLLPAAAIGAACEAAGVAGEAGLAAATDDPRTPDLDGAWHLATPVQQRLWFLARLPALRKAYMAPTVLEYTGQAVEPHRLQEAARLVLQRHPALRSRFRLDRTCRAVVYRTDGPPPQVRYINAAAADWSDEEIRSHLADACWAPFDLAVEAPARAEVISTATATLLVLTFHHLVSDGWSLRLVMDEISEVYLASAQGRAPRLTAPVHPASLTGALPAATAPTAATGHDYDRSCRTAPVAQPVALAEVLASMRDAPLDIDLPHDRPRPEVQSTLGATASIRLGPELTRRILAMAREHECTTFVLLVTLLSVVLARRGRQRDCVFCFPWAGREAPESADAVGMFVNTLLIRADLTDRPTWRGLLNRIRIASRASFERAEVPFDALAAALDPHRDLSRPPVTPVMVSVVEAPPAAPDLGTNTSGRMLPTPGPLHVKYELAISAIDHPADLELSVDYATELFDRSTITALLAGMRNSARELVTTPEATVPEALPDLVDLIKRAWQDILAVDTVLPDVSFFEAGGNSLLLVMLLEELSELTDQELTEADLFRHNTVLSQAELISGEYSQAPPVGRGASQRHLLLDRARRSRPDEVET